MAEQGQNHPRMQVVVPLPHTIWSIVQRFHLPQHSLLILTSTQWPTQTEVVIGDCPVKPLFEEGRSHWSTLHHCGERGAHDELSKSPNKTKCLHRRVSNAFLKSMVMNTQHDVFLLLNVCVNFYARLMQFDIHLLMKTTWLSLIIFGNIVSKRLANSLEITLYKTPTYEIGQYLSSVVDASVFGMRTRNVWFIKPNILRVGEIIYDL